MALVLGVESVTGFGRRRCSISTATVWLERDGVGAGAGAGLAVCDTRDFRFGAI